MCIMYIVHISTCKCVLSIYWYAPSFMLVVVQICKDNKVIYKKKQNKKIEEINTIKNYPLGQSDV